MNPTVRRRTKVLVVTFLVLIAGSTLLGSSAAAQFVPPTDSGGGDTGAGTAPAAETDLAGYKGLATTSGLHVFYNPEGLLPTAALLDLGSPDALATISSGPVTYARASIADPGDLLANPEPLLATDPNYPAGTVPAYPYRAEANSGTGEPQVESTPAPGLSAVAEARPDSSRARATTPAAVAPRVAGFGTIASESTTRIETSSVEVHARTVLSGFSLLNIVKIDSVVTDVKATSDGKETKVSGGTTITGATVMDQPVIIDADGVHAAPGAEAEEEPAPLLPGLKPVTDALRGDPGELLARAGIRISAAGPLEQKGGGSGQLSTTGLRIDIEISNDTYPQLTQLADLVPPIDSPPGAPVGVGDALQALRARNLVALELGRAQVTLTAKRSTVDEGTFDDTFVPSDSSFTDGGGSDLGSTDFGSTDFADGPIAAPSVARPSAGATLGGPALPKGTPIASVGAGIGALAVLALLAQPLVGARLASAVTGILGAGDDEHCLREER